MAVQLFKLIMSATTNTNAVPTEYRYFNTVTGAQTTTELFITKSQFVKDDGNAATAIVTQVTDNGYYSLFINGQLQQSALYTVAASGLTIADSPAMSFRVSEPITLTVTNFAPTSSTVVTG